MPTNDTAPSSRFVTVADLEAAAERICGIAVRTPLLSAETAGHPRFWVKPENLQPVGAFKLRGAYNAIAALPDDIRRRGVVAFSSGNHAQGVAFAARRFCIPAWIVIEDSAPQIKVDATVALGATVITAPMTEREIVAQELADRHGTVVIPSFSSIDVMAGQGTVGLEIIADRATVDTVLVPVSGGGLASGVAAAIKYRAPHVRVLIVEPDLAADTAESLQRGELIRWSPQDRRRTIADGLGGQPTELSFRHMQRFTDGAVTVSENEIRDAMKFLASSLKLVAEPSGAVATAAYLFHRDLIGAGETVAVISGGNVSPHTYLQLLAQSRV